MNRTIEFPSITYAQKALKLLEAAGIRTRLSKRSQRGCGYSLVVAKTALQPALDALKQAGIPHSV